jgi:site-specific DNA-adenine methylase
VNLPFIYTQRHELNFIRKDILNLENNIKNNYDSLKKSVINIQFQKHIEFQKQQEEAKKKELILLIT